ncbi:MAG: hypothetical protein ABIS92_09925 [Polyangia bacterium]
MLTSMARVLLYWTFWSTFVSFAGCVLPVSPDFQNPPAIPNSYPYFWNIFPAAESTVTFPSAGSGEPFKIQLGDPNLDDTLYVRWISDYPPFAINVSKVLSDGANGTGLAIVPTPKAPTKLRPEIFFPASCESFSPGMQQHRLVVIVADRPFLRAGTFDDGLRYNRVAAQSNTDQSPVTNPIVAGWNVICPP